MVTCRFSYLSEDVGGMVCGEALGGNRRRRTTGSSDLRYSRSFENCPTGSVSQKHDHVSPYLSKL